MVGRGNRLTDAERKARGTYRADESEAVYAARDAAKIVKGPWLDHIPDPTVKLNDVGMRKYEEITRGLLDAGRLNMHFKDMAEAVALMYQQIVAASETGKPVSGQFFYQYQLAMKGLRLQEDAKPIAEREGSNKFAGIGLANKRGSSLRLLKSSEAGSRK
jgi:hypothetical protein